MKYTIEQFVTEIRKLAEDASSPNRTHVEGCWRWHLPCALYRASEIIEYLQEGLEGNSLDERQG